MTVLAKKLIYEYIPGTSGVTGSAGSPFVPAYCVFEPGVTITTASNTGKVQVWVPVADNPLTMGYDGGGFWVWQDSIGSVGTEVGSSYTLPGTTTCYDAVPAVPGTAYEPATPTEINYYYNEGWNSHSRSVDSLDEGNTFFCTVASGIVGVFIGVGEKGLDERTIGSFSHGVLVDSSGAYVYESGSLVSTLSSTAIGADEVEIKRTSSNGIEYTVDTTTYTSLVSFPVASGTQSFIYAFLYSGNDSLLTARFDAVDSTVTYDGAEVESTLGALNGISGESPFVVQQFAYLSALTGSAEEGSVVPSTPIRFLGNLPAIVGSSSSVGLQINGFEGQLEIPVPRVTGVFGMTGGVTIPTAVVTGTLIAPLELEGDLKIPAAKVTGEFSSSRMFEGNIIIKPVVVTGILIAGDYFEGSIFIAKTKVSGEFNTTQLGDWEASIVVPVAKVSGTLDDGVDTTDDIFTYSGSASCQQ